ncbi:hypothetical protein [Streptomyces sp. NBC_01803]|uniref:hypothetical protein n=1 Tax=Streptomyces sp. NBC_01803 TaxID=2975946 RepID=UPI002DD9742B|nr:hypothetical protein [Streptomyces sp. NBC_01803]WSA45658.1 hypothetical protein OIE51_16485 [Streptomyces sp. NBC_01803]
MRGLNRLVRRLRPTPRGDYANDGFPVEHPRRRPGRGAEPRDTGRPSPGADPA